MKTVKVSGRVAKLAWDQTVGGVRRTQSLQTGSQVGPQPTSIWGLDVQSGHRNALSQHLREERCHQKKRSIEKMWIPKPEGDVI